MSISDMFKSIIDEMSILYHNTLCGDLINLIFGFWLFNCSISIVNRFMRYSCHDLDRIENKKSWKYERSDI